MKIRVEFTDVPLHQDGTFVMSTGEIEGMDVNRLFTSIEDYILQVLVQTRKLEVRE